MAPGPFGGGVNARRSENAFPGEGRGVPQVGALAPWCLPLMGEGTRSLDAEGLRDTGKRWGVRGGQWLGSYGGGLRWQGLQL